MMAAADSRAWSHTGFPAFRYPMLEEASMTSAISLGASPDHTKALLRSIGIAKATPMRPMIRVRRSHRRRFSSRTLLEDRFSASFRKRRVGKVIVTLRRFCMRCRKSGTLAPTTAAIKNSGKRNMGGYFDMRLRSSR